MRGSGFAQEARGWVRELRDLECFRSGRGFGELGRGFVGGDLARMWTIVHPFVSQCCQAAGMARARLVGSGAAVMASHCLLRSVVAVPLVYVPLKDYEVVGLQQLS